MKISNLREQERISSQYNRKKILQRKEAGEAYRKNAMYFQPKKNPALLELENLLLGRTDQDLFEQQQEKSKEVTPQQQAIMEDLRQTEKNVRAHERSYKEGTSDSAESSTVVNPEQNDTLQILEQVRHAALASTEPSPQDLQVAQSVNAQIQHILNDSYTEEGKIGEEEPSFVRDIMEVKVPERFSKELKLDPFADTIFGKNYETAFKLRTFHQVSEKYAAHVQMTKNGYRPDTDSMFSLIA
ncbi:MULTISPECIES: hypothetical protein [Lysinibacillus]|jgi:hypothetical protein|uniref:hypothetical protein n=1 Tax=Lysinibacillus TaxID=400634 RepID=UPI002EAFF4DA|nr:hypothetical protein [Lysinibacillus fusiformis]